ncbi:arsenic resistance protein [Selenomonas montiformis]|uniref:arsenic resistance protein n=1 Tax=Selenomonas montiformis TaxID=2652285 RepID=UPI002E26F822
MNNRSKAMNTFQRYLSVWVLLCMAIGVLIGHFVPIVPVTLGMFQIFGISIPIAVLIWVMIYPMMMKVDFQSIKQIGKNPKGLLVTWVTNWLIKSFTMYGIAYLFWFVVIPLIGGILTRMTVMLLLVRIATKRME